MAANIEMVNGIASFAENVKSGIAWHGLGQKVEGAMYVGDALKLSHADYQVKLQPIVALSDEVVSAIENNEFISAAMLRELLVEGKKATVRTDLNTALGITSDGYGLVQNEDAFKFVDMFCSGKNADRDNTPVIETCGVLGKGERVFVTAKFPQPIVLDAKRDDLIDMYVVFTTSHDGTGAVRCMCSPIRVVCNNTLSLAMTNNIGRISFRHSSNVMSRLDLLNKENAEFAYKSLNVAEVYANGLKESLDHLRTIRLSEQVLDEIIADIALADDAKKVFLETKNIYHEDIATRGRNIFLGMKNAIEGGIGQDILDRGTALWAINGITTFYQNQANFKNDEVKFDNLMEGNVYKKVNRAYSRLLAA